MKKDKRKSDKKLIITDEESRRIKNANKESRPCLKCLEPFLSDGKANRICPSCSEDNIKVGKIEGEFIGKKSRNGKIREQQSVALTLDTHLIKRLDVPLGHTSHLESLQLAAFTREWPVDWTHISDQDIVILDTHLIYKLADYILDTHLNLGLYRVHTGMAGGLDTHLVRSLIHKGRSWTHISLLIDGLDTHLSFGSLLFEGQRKRWAWTHISVLGLSIYHKKYPYTLDTHLSKSPRRSSLDTHLVSSSDLGQHI